jgi:hypothetical protein
MSTGLATKWMRSKAKSRSRLRRHSCPPRGQTQASPATAKGALSGFRRFDDSGYLTRDPDTEEQRP